jgi:hypothetical protein
LDYLRIYNCFVRLRILLILSFLVFIGVGLAVYLFFWGGGVKGLVDFSSSEPAGSVQGSWRKSISASSSDRGLNMSGFDPLGLLSEAEVLIKAGNFDLAAQRFWLALAYGVYGKYLNEDSELLGSENLLNRAVEGLDNGLTEQERRDFRLSTSRFLAGDLMGYLNKEGPPANGGVSEEAWRKTLEEFSRLIGGRSLVLTEDLVPISPRRGTLVNGPLLDEVKGALRRFAEGRDISPIRKATPFVVAFAEGSEDSLVWQERWVLRGGDGAEVGVILTFWEDPSSEVLYQREGGFGTMGVRWEVGDF